MEDFEVLSEITTRLRIQESEPDALSSTLKYFVLSGMFRQYLYSLATRPAHHVLNGYQYPNGFSKIILLESPESWSLRLHYWPKGHEESDAHSHRWNFCSYIVSGIISAYEYQLVPGDNFEAFDCFRSDNGNYVMQSLGSTGLVRSDDTTWKRGDFYTQSFGDLHRAAAVREAYTLILHGSSLFCRNVTAWFRLGG